MFKCCNQVTKKKEKNENGTEIVFLFLENRRIYIC